MNSIIKDKAQYRLRLKHARASLSDQQRRQFDQSIMVKLLAQAEIHTASTLFCFISSGTEVATHELIRVWQEQGKTIAVPKIINSTQMIAVQIGAWDDLEPAELGILTPNASEPVQENIDVCITPGLGFSPAGQRLGFGRGYYDKWFSINTVKHKIAICYSCQLLEDIPTEETDYPVDMIVMEDRIVRL